MYNSKINIGENSFLVQFRKYKEDNNFISKKYVFIRKYYIINNIIYDKEIFVIDKDIALTVIEDLNKNDSETTEKIVFPYLDNKKSYYSNNYKNFNSSFNKKRFKIKDDIFESSDIYNIVDKNGNPIFIPCNEIRIYHPTELIKLKSIIHLDSYYNDIHFHFYCNKYENHDIYVDNEIKIDNNIYSEYIKFYIPDIEYLFYEEYKKDNNNLPDYNLPDSKNTYFFEDLSINEIEDENNPYINKTILKIGNKTLFPFNLIIKPFKVEKLFIQGFNIDVYKKIFIKNNKSIENNYITSPINLTIYPYKYIDENNYLYILSNKFDSSTITFFKGYNFRLTSKIGFDKDGYCSVINKFLYENSDIYSIKEAYSLYNNVTEEDYRKALNNLYRKYYKKAVYNNPNNIPKKDKSSGLEMGNPYNFDTYEEYYKDDDKVINITDLKDKEDYINEEYISDLNIENDSEFFNENEIKLLGFKFEISTDLDFKNIIYTVYSEQNFIDDFTFNISNIFDGWDNMPDILVARSIFIDKYLGNVISSNRITITKEWFKYLINSDFYNSDKIPFVKLNFNKTYIGNDSNSLIIKNKKEEGDIELTKNNLIDNNFMDVANGFNFIDKINCNIIKENKDDNFKGNSLGSVKILYKPIFFRVKELQNIKLKSGVTQKIGINLSDYMTKVESFKLNIESNMFKEISRNDSYIIFEINANLLKENQGRYVITNEDDDYISDGIYTLY